MTPMTQLRRNAGAVFSTAPAPGVMCGGVFRRHYNPVLIYFNIGIYQII